MVSHVVGNSFETAFKETKTSFSGVVSVGILPVGCGPAPPVILVLVLERWTWQELRAYVNDTTRHHDAPW